MSDPLELLLHDGIIEAVISRLKSGKEADIFLVQQPTDIVAAKIYKDRQERSFKNNAAYREGRTVRNSRTQRAIAKGTRFGQAAAEHDWKAREADALHKLHAAGVRVPKPVLFYEGVLLMELVIDVNGHPAPRLIDAHVPREHAAALYADLRSQIIRMLCADVIHGDLSPYNVLLAWNGPTIIDFPQMVDAAHNRQAWFFFHRDLETLRKFFAAADPALNQQADDARQIWRLWEKRELSADFVPRPGQPPRFEQRGPGGGPPRGRDDRRGPPGGGPPQQRGEQRGPPRNRDERRGPPQGGAPGGGAPQREQRGAPPQQRGEQRGPPQQRGEQRGPPQQRGEQRGPPQQQRGEQRGPPPQQRGEQRGPPQQQRGEQRGPSQQQRGEQRGPPRERFDQRGPPQQQRGEQRGPPNRGQPPSGPAVSYVGRPPAPQQNPTAPSGGNPNSSHQRHGRRGRGRGRGGGGQQGGGGGAVR